MSAPALTVSAVAGFALTAAAAVLLIIGAWRRWRWLVDPPLSLWPVHPYAVLRHLFGRGVVVWIVYLTGLGMIVILVYVFARIFVFR